jgi:hypothetical protein
MHCLPRHYGTMPSLYFCSATTSPQTNVFVNGISIYLLSDFWVSQQGLTQLGEQFILL